MTSIRTIRQSLADRLREVRVDRFGDDETGLEAIGNAIGIPSETWSNYEDGVVVPAEVLLKLIELTRVNTHWLLSGKGSRFLRTDPNLKYQSFN